MKKRPILKSMIITCALLMLCPAFVMTLGMSLKTVYSETYYGALKTKIDRLNSVKDKKIVVIGGSSVAFGIKSNLIEEELDYKVVNFGLYANLGTKLMLELAKDKINKDDIVIITPEQNEQALSMYFNASATLMALESNKKEFFKLDEEDKKVLSANYPSFVMEKLKRSIEGIKLEDTVYKASSINSYGDIEYSEREQNIMSLGYDPTMSIDFTKKIDNEFVNYINDYSNVLTQKGAKVYYHLCPMNEDAIVDINEVDNYYSYLLDTLNIRVIGDPHASIMEKEWFYDTNFHLNDSGAILNTINLVKDLKAELKINSKVNIVTPNKPALSENYNLTKNIDYIDYFNVEGNKIVSLKDNASSLSEVYVPTHNGDKIIKSFDVNTFKNNKSIKRVIVPTSIGVLYDGSFDNTNIEEVILLGSPKNYKVGNELFKNKNLKILVNKKYISSYMYDYSWSQYSSNISSFEEGQYE